MSKGFSSFCTLFALIGGLTLSACSGSSTPAAPVPHPTPSPTATPAQTASTSLEVVIPHSQKQKSAATRTRPPRRLSSARRRPAYISPYSRSILIYIDGNLADGEDLSPSNPDCSTLQNGDLDCTISIAPPVGSDFFDIALWDTSAVEAEAGTGNVLSTSQFTFNVTGGPQVLDVALEGVVRSVTLTPSEDYIPLSLQPLSVPEWIQLTVAAYDADGNQIGDPSSDQVNYHAPIVVSDRDVSGVTSLVTTTNSVPPLTGRGAASVSVPNGATNVFALYSGSFIRATGFDPTSADVTNPSNLVSAGLAFDCMGGTGKIPALAKRAALRRPAPARFARPVSHIGQLRPSLAGGTDGIEYDPNILTNCSWYYGYNCTMGNFAPGECVTMPVYWDTGNPSDTLEWNVSISPGELQISFSPAETGSPGTTCVSLYAPPSTQGIGDIYQINASTPWFGGQLNHPLIDVGFGVSTALSIDPSTYGTRRADC